MAIRRITAADIDTIRAKWDTYRALATDYAREQGWTRTDVQDWRANPDYFVAIDPVTETVGIFVAELPDTVRVELVITLRTGVAGVRAADAMLIWGWNGAITRGALHSYGVYEFPAGVDAAQTRAVRYFGSMPSLTVHPFVVQPDGSTYVRITCDDLPAAVAFMEARA